MKRSKRKQRFEQVDLYPVITEKFCKGRSSLDVLNGCLDAGVKIVQLREKEIGKNALYQLAIEYRKRTLDAGALLIINDHLDVALAVDADGVHLGRDDLPIAAARAIAPDTLLGASTHNLGQVLEAIEADADYVNVGPIYPTGTKPEHTEFLGPEILATLVPYLSIPFSVMGGIKIDNVEPLLAAGARHIAVVTAVTAADDVQAAAVALRRKILAERK